MKNNGLSLHSQIMRGLKKHSLSLNYLLTPVVIAILISAIAILPNVLELGLKNSSITSMLSDCSDQSEKESEKTDDLNDMMIVHFNQFSFISNSHQLFMATTLFVKLCNGYEGKLSPPPDSATIC